MCNTKPFLIRTFMKIQPNNLLEEWFKRGMKETPEEMSTLWNPIQSGNYNVNTKKKVPIK